MLKRWKETGVKHQSKNTTPRQSQRLKKKKQHTPVVKLQVSIKKQVEPVKRKASVKKPRKTETAKKQVVVKRKTTEKKVVKKPRKTEIVKKQTFVQTTPMPIPYWSVNPRQQLMHLVSKSARKPTPSPR